MIPPPVQLPNPDDKKYPVTRALAGRRAFPLNEPGLARVTSLFPKDRNSELLKIIDELDVENSPRYLKQWNEKLGRFSTFCNIYAFDVCFLANEYMAHVYWTPEALEQMQATGIVPRIKLSDPGQTITEISANGLYDWMEKYSVLYGWARTQDPEVAQAVVNAGGLGLCVARIKPIGHVAVIVPESPQHLAQVDNDGDIIAPLMSQAGSSNYKFYSKAWYKRSLQWGFWVNAAPINFAGILDSTSKLVDDLDSLF